MARRSLLIIYFVLVVGLLLVPSSYSDKKRLAFPDEPKLCTTEDLAEPIGPDQPCGSGAELNADTHLCVCKAGFIDAPRDSLRRKRCKSAKPEVDFMPYITAMQKKIRRAWQPPWISRFHMPLEAKFLFWVSRDGSVSKICLEQASAHDAYNKSGYKAILKAAPFQPLPVGYKEDSIKTEFNFNMTHR